MNSSNMKKHLTLSVFAVILILGAHAQFQLKTDIRPRFELRNGYKSLSKETSEPSAFVSQRTRLMANYQTDLYELGAGIQNVGVWGSSQNYSATGVWGDSSAIMMNEAWVKLLPGKKHAITIGRQQWAYDNQRLLASRDFNQFGQFYDGLLYSFTDSSLQADVGLSYNSRSESLFHEPFYTDANRMKTLDFVYLKKGLSKTLSASMLGLLAGYEDAGDMRVVHFTATAGGNVFLKNKKFNATATAYYQAGENAVGQNVQAYFAAAEAHYWLIDKKLRFGLGTDYYSGQDANNDDETYAASDHSFDILYGARFKFNGNMNYYVFAGKPMDQGGLMDNYARVLWKLGKNGKLSADYHLFSLTANYNLMGADGLNETISKSLGSEIDIRFSKKMLKDILFQAGASYYLPTASIERLKGMPEGSSAENYYVWTSIQLKTSIFKSKESVE